MSKLYYAGAKFCGEDGFEQIELDSSGHSLIRQWLPDTQEIRESLRKWGAVEITMGELNTMYANGVHK